MTDTPTGRWGSGEPELQDARPRPRPTRIGIIGLAADYAKIEEKIMALGLSDVDLLRFDSERDLHQIMSVDEADQMLKDFKESFPEIQKFHDRLHDRQAAGDVTGFYGRRRKLR